MSADHQQTFVYAGLAGEGEYIGAGGLYRYAADNGEWQSLTNGLPNDPQVRALLMHPQNPAILYAGTQRGPYRSDDRGEHWTALEDTLRRGQTSGRWRSIRTMPTSSMPDMSPVPSIVLRMAVNTGNG